MIGQQLTEILDEFQSYANLNKGDILVIGCSTSEVIGKRIGTSSSEEVASEIINVLLQKSKEYQFSLAIQCCEHLNRALVIEKDTMEENNLEEVSVIPHPKAGGALASKAMEYFKDPVVVENIMSKAKGGIDIGSTLIGMHLRHVAVPLRFKNKYIGEAYVTGAKTRPKLIGGERAYYKREGS